ncbi:ribonuclease activity regulator RraA [Bordetella genomosp. 13]|uniref:ribonuclease activity regulator RraA n=1 Tax=Bordetella genomosp. 13 TaxID=463040 RepID=UPI00119D7E5A|nr:ribonuclease activity regulator RraA [Bordetella genomosp. 13]
MGMDPIELDNDIVRALSSVTTATLTTVLLKKGLRNVWMRGAKPIRTGQSRVVGRAFTMRFVPAREDLATPASWSSLISTRSAIEAIPPGCIVVVDAMGVTDAGIFGDILCARMAKRKVLGLVTDGAMRDMDGVLDTDLPVWCAGAAAPPSVAGLTFVGWQEPIGCGGVAVYPDDIVVADGDGAVLIPAALLDEVIDAAVEQERQDGWIMQQVAEGQSLPGLYPPNEENRARYEAWVKQQL